MPMRNSRMTDAWIAQVLAGNPIRVAEKTGNMLALGRLAFPNLLNPAPPMAGEPVNDAKKPTYNTVLLFPPGSEHGINTVLYPMWMAEMQKSFPNHQPSALHNPFRDQGEKQQYGGYTPGLPFITPSTTMKPQVVDTANNPIIDPARIYAGVWAIVSMNFFSFGLRPVRPKKGVSFGLQSVMIIADDEALGGTAPPAADDFAGVRIDQAFDPSGQFGNTPAAAPAYRPPGAVLPPAQPIAAAPAPSGAVQGWRPPGAAPANPAAPGGWSPPAAYAAPPIAAALPPGVSNEQTLYGAKPTSVEDVW